MTVKHTPAPWVFEELRVADGDGYVFAEGGSIEIVHVGGAYSRGLPRDEVLANARLIAQAPALLAALQAACGYLLNAHIDLSTGASKQTAMQTIEGGLKVVRAALAKADPATPT